MMIFKCGSDTVKVHKNVLREKVLLTSSDEDSYTRVALTPEIAKQIANELLAVANKIEEENGVIR